MHLESAIPCSPLRIKSSLEIPDLAVNTEVNPARFFSCSVKGFCCSVLQSVKVSNSPPWFHFDNDASGTYNTPSWSHRLRCCSSVSRPNSERRKPETLNVGCPEQLESKASRVGGTIRYQPINVRASACRVLTLDHFVFWIDRRFGAWAWVFGTVRTFFARERRFSNASFGLNSKSSTFDFIAAIYHDAAFLSTAYAGKGSAVASVLPVSSEYVTRRPTTALATPTKRSPSFRLRSLNRYACSSRYRNR